jgi:hypothetical protein
MYDATFPIHLVVIKVAIFIPKKTKVGAFVQPLLDSQLLNKWSFFFQLTMSHNAEPIMVESSNKNLIFRLWMKIISSPIMICKLSEYKNLVDIVMV